MSKPTYTLTLNARQAEVVVAALDLYSRIGIGQFDEIITVYEAGVGFKSPSSKVVAATRMVEDAKEELTGYPPNASHGIHSKEIADVFRVAHDIQQVVRHAVAWARTPEGNPRHVHFDTPNRVSEDEELPTILTTKE